MMTLGDLITPAPVIRAGTADLPILSMTMHGGLIDQSQKFKKRVASNDLSEYKVVALGQLVVGFPIDEGVLDFQGLYKNGIVSPAYGVWDLRAEETIDRNYFKRFLRSPPAMTYYKERLRGSTARRRSLPSDVFLALEVPVPPLVEQRRITAILDRADALRSKQTTVVEHIDLLNQAIFGDMFGALLSEELGPKLEFITSGGRGWAKYYASTGEPFIRSLDVRFNSVALEELAHVNAPNNAEAKRTRTQIGDVLLTITGSRIGRAAPVPDHLAGAYVSQHVAILRPKPGTLEPDFLSAFLCSSMYGQRQILAAQYGQTKPGLNFDQIRSFRVPAADAGRQMRFRDTVRHVSEAASIAHAAKLEHEALFASLQSRAFSGQLVGSDG